MARIRTVKPEFWDSPGTIRASLRGRLLYIAMWNWADDYGIGDGNLNRLISFAFPGDHLPASDFPTLASEMSDCFGVVFYEHAGRPYYWIPAWEKHQRTEKKAKQHVPFPDPTKPTPDQARETSETSVGDSAEGVGFTGSGTGEQGEVGTGEQGNQGTGAQKRAHRIPDPFVVTSEMRAWAAEEVPTVDVDAVTRMFVDHWRAESGAKATKLDWVATWRNWLRREPKQRAARPAQRESSIDRQRRQAQQMLTDLANNNGSHLRAIGGN